MVRLSFVTAVLLLLHTLQPNAFPTTSENQDSLVIFNSSVNTITPQCYTPESRDIPGIQPVDLQSCQAALLVLVHERNFATRFRFSRNPRAQAIRVPRGWQPGSDAKCRIIINCENDRDTAVLRFADIAQAAKRIIDNCVEKPDPRGMLPMLKWGGVDGLDGEETFYVAVARPIEFQLGIGVANGTISTGGGLIDGGVESS